MISIVPPIKIAIVDDHNLFRKGLIKLINLSDPQHRYKILFEAENGNDMKDKMRNPPFPEIILMDIEMPDINGFEAVEWLQRTHPSVKVLVITMLESENDIMRMLKLGVKGYLSKDIEVEDMHKALETISNNGMYYSNVAVEVMNKGLNDKGNQSCGQTNLTENEREFLLLSTTGLTYQQIAEKMHLSPKTIDGYREYFFKKLNLKNRSELVLYAVKIGVVKV